MPLCEKCEKKIFLDAVENKPCPICGKNSVQATQKMCEQCSQKQKKCRCCEKPLPA